MIEDDYIRLKLNHKSLGNYVIRKSILGFINNNLQRFNGEVVDIGCGFMPYKSLILSDSSNASNYIGLDLADNIYQKPDLEWDGKTIPLNDSSVDTAIATEVLEHCPDPDNILKEVYRILKVKGGFFFTVPFVYPLYCIPNDEYRYTPFSIERHLRKSGFEDISISPIGGWDTALSQMIGMWTNQNYKNRPRLKKIACYLILPVMKFLINRDKPSNSFSDNQMFIGLTGFAYKL